LYFGSPPQKTTGFKKSIPLLVTLMFLAGGLWVFYTLSKNHRRPTRVPVTPQTVAAREAAVSAKPSVQETTIDEPEPDAEKEADPVSPFEETPAAMLAEVREPAEEVAVSEEPKTEKTETAQAETERPHPPELQALNDEYEKNRAQIEANHLKNIERLKDAYVKCLDQRAKQLQKTGDLHGMLAFKREKERFEKDGEFPSFVDERAKPSLCKAQRKVIGYLEKVQTARIQKLKQVTRDHVTKLSSLEIELTTQRRIQDAMVVRAEKERVEFEGQIMASVNMTSANTRLF
jgi:hypothetical protein